MRLDHSSPQWLIYSRIIIQTYICILAWTLANTSFSYNLRHPFIFFLVPIKKNSCKIWNQSFKFVIRFPWELKVYCSLMRKVDNFYKKKSKTFCYNIFFRVKENRIENRTENIIMICKLQFLTYFLWYGSAWSFYGMIHDKYTREMYNISNHIIMWAGKQQLNCERLDLWSNSPRGF